MPQALVHFKTVTHSKVRRLLKKTGKKTGKSFFGCFASVYELKARKSLRVVVASPFLANQRMIDSI
jgi:hypothetical protein